MRQQLIACTIPPDDSSNEYIYAKGKQLLRNISRATGCHRLVLYIDNQDRCLRRNPTRCAPDMLIHHQVANHQNATG
jgi:hypothetical protein